MNEFVPRKIIQYRNKQKTEKVDIVVSEITISVKVQCEYAGTFTCTPTFLDDLVAGFLITAGIVTEKNRIIHLEYITEKNQFDVTMENNNVLNDEDFEIIKPVGCAGGSQMMIQRRRRYGIQGEIVISKETISTLMRDFNKRSELFRTTGGVHSSAIADLNGILLFREDIGRHNAVDKVIGAMYLNNQIVTDKILLTSGRISSEIILKALNAGVPIIISGSAPTEKGIQLAEKSNLTLIGFARSDNFNVYCCFERVKF